MQLPKKEVPCWMLEIVLVIFYVIILVGIVSIAIIEITNAHEGKDRPNLKTMENSRCIITKKHH